MSFAINDVVSLTLPAGHGALANGGLAVVHRISPDGLFIFVKTTASSPIYKIDASAVSAATGQKGPAPFPPSLSAGSHRSVFDERD